MTFLEVLRCLGAHGLFEIPDSLQPFVEPDAAGLAETTEVRGDEQDEAGVIQAWRVFVEGPYAQIVPYAKYLADDGTFDTHQGVKGLEFKPVMVLLDDQEARGFIYSYDKLLGVVAPSDTDIQNEGEGRDTSIARTRRLLYVTYTRAEDSLAVLVYTNNPGNVRNRVVAHGWFEPGEIVLL